MKRKVKGQKSKVKSQKFIGPNAPDAFGAALDRDRSFVVNQALASYVETHQWQVGHIQQGLREGKAGRFVSEANVNRVVARLRRK